MKENEEIKIGLKFAIIIIIIGVMAGIFFKIYKLNGVKDSNDIMAKQENTTGVNNILNTEDTKVTKETEDIENKENTKDTENKENREDTNDKQIQITDEILKGDWKFEKVTDKNGNEISPMTIFGSLGITGDFTFYDNKKFTNNITGGRSSEFIDDGIYTIKNNTTIELKYDDGRNGELTYDIENEFLIDNENDYILYMSKRT